MVAPLRIGTYVGDGEDAAVLLRKAWSPAYAGKIWYPLWDSAYLRWQMAVHGRDLCVAAYAEDRLVGCFFAMPIRLALSGRTVEVSLSSWLAVDPDIRSPDVARRMLAELERRHQEGGYAFSLGVVSGDPNTLAHRFWKRFAQVAPRQIVFMMRFGFWIKLLDSRVVGRAAIKRWERVGASALGPILTGSLLPNESSLRVYRPEDLEGCQALLTRTGHDLEWRIEWSPDKFAAQLQAPPVRTWVWEHDGVVTAMANCHLISFQGREVVPAAIIDILATAGLPPLARARFVSEVCGALRQEGAAFALILRAGDSSTLPLLANTFLPLPAEDLWFLLFPQEKHSAPRSWRLLFR